MRVELEKVRKKYGKLLALDQIDLDLPAGERVALIGPNGSGKTTLTRVLMGLVAHDGAVRYDGAKERPDTIAYVPQVAPQMAAPVGELVRTIASVRQMDPRRVTQYAAELDLDTAAVAKRPFRGLSGGMKQKLLLAIALAAAPELVILDEPTASLDAAARAKFAALETKVFAGATVILCSHRLDEVRAMVGRVISLADGRVAHDGPAADFVTAHTTSVVEVRVDADDGAWLAERGFTAGAHGWWTRAVDHAVKMAIVPEIVAHLRIRDLVVRDLDRLAVTS